MTLENQNEYHGPPTDGSEREMTSDEIAGWAEYCCWVTVVLTPILIWWNGPSVSDDQAIVRTGLCVISAIGAVSFRTYNWLMRREK